jgi:tRNA 2-thiocytidine biosynthesis protein TtcA
MLENQVLKTIRSKFKKSIDQYGLIDDGDHILIGLSGGKDSLALVELLGERMKIFVPRFQLTAVHISVDNIPYQSNLEYLRNFTSTYEIPFVHHITHFEEIDDKKKSLCFLCSWHRRKALFDVAKQLKCNKIALGHHLDDSIETLLMNLIFQGSFSSMPPKLQMNKFDMKIIRPLSLISENELQQMAEIHQYEKQIKNCPHEKDSSRGDAKHLVKTLEKLNPHAKQSIWKAMENVKQEYLPQKVNKNLQ